jgi:hypothetical protein
MKSHLSMALDGFLTHISNLVVSRRLFLVLLGCGAIATGQPVSAADCVPPSSGLVSWWRAESNADDAANGNNGTFTSPSFRSGQVGLAFDFNGNNNAVAADHLSLNPTNAITIECWVNARRLTASYAQDLVSKDADFAGPRQYLLSMGPPPGLDNGTGGFRAHVGVPSAGGGLVFIDGSTRVQINTWYHVAMTYDGVTLKLYVNGHLDAQKAVTGPIIVTTQPVRMGGGAPAGSPPYFFNGLMDEVSLYSRALGQDEIQAIYNAGNAGKCAPTPPPTCVPAPAGLVSWWRGENSTADAADGNNGTIAGTGTVTYGPGVVGLAFVFDGTHRDRVDLGNPTNLRLEDFTLEAWVKRSSPTVTSFDILGADGSVAGDGAVIFGYGRGGYGFGLANNGRMFLSRIDLDGLFSVPLVTDTNWHHLAVTKSGANAVFYVDGVPQATPAYVHPAPYTFDDGTCVCSAAVSIGSRGDARGGTFFGMIDEPAVFNRALTASEIQAIYNAGNAGKCAPTPPPTCVPAPAGLVSWWRGENSTADAADGNNGTWAGFGNTNSYGPGVVGQAFVFDGTHRDRVNLGNPTNLRLEDFTLEAWVKRSSPTVTSFDVLGADGSVSGDGAAIFGYGRGGYIFALANNGRMILSRTDMDGLISVPLVTDTNWHHLAVTKSGLNAVFYVDGVPQATPAYVHPAPYTFDDGTCVCSAAASIGSRGDARGGTFYGMIDEPAVFNRALSADDIQAIYAAGSTGICKEPPVILTQPVSQKVTVGLNATFSVVASGTPQLRYQWRFNGDDIAGATDSTFSFTVSDTSGGLYCVRVTNAFGSVLSSNALLVVNHPPVADAGATPLLFISPNGTNSPVVLNGSRSLDPDGDLLHYAWYETGVTNPLATGVVAVVVLPVGAHPLELVVNDGLVTGTNAITVEVITTAQAVERLAAAVSDDVSRAQPLIATLLAALASLDRSNPTAAINQLQAFQNQVRAQVSPLDPLLAEHFIQATQQIIDSLIEGSGRAHGKFSSFSRQADGKTRLQFEAAPGALYIIEASTNLVDWEKIGVATDNGTFEFEDANAGLYRARYYRIILP